jgi:hypothetical protein
MTTLMPSAEIKFDIIDNKLQEVITLVKAKRPLFEFQPMRRRHNYEDKMVLFGVHVYMKGVHLGNIRTDFERHDREGKKSNWIAITANTIRKERGPRNMKVAKDVSKAVKIAFDHLLFPETQALGKPLKELGFELLDSLCDNTRYRLKDSVRIGDSIDVLVYFIQKARGSEIPVPTRLQSFDDEVYKKYKTYLSTSYLMDQWKAGSLHVVRHLIDGAYASVICRDETSYVRYETTYDMPPFMQEKITMLKLMNKYEPLDHVGVRLESRGDEQPVYLITDGDTVTV